MKKITLSAAILAMTMMGCSDMGVDNSVASTSDVKQEQSHNSLAKVNDPQNAVYHRLLNMQPTDINGNGYQYFAFPEAGIGIMFQTRDDLDWDGWEAQGELYVADKPYNPNTIYVATGLFSDCEFNEPYYTTANCRGWKLVGEAEGKNVSGVLAVSPRNPSGQKLSKYKWYMEVGAVSAFVGVWNEGSPYETVENGATYHGGMFEDHGDQKARAIYRTYIWPKVRSNFF